MYCSRKRTFRVFLIILSTVLLFLYGKNYKYVESFLLDINNLVGACFIVIGGLCLTLFYFIMKGRTDQEKIYRLDEKQRAGENEIRRLNKKIANLKEQLQLKQVEINNYQK